MKCIHVLQVSEVNEDILVMILSRSYLNLRTFIHMHY